MADLRCKDGSLLFAHSGPFLRRMTWLWLRHPPPGIHRRDRHFQVPRRSKYHDHRLGARIYGAASKPTSPRSEVTLTLAASVMVSSVALSPNILTSSLPN